MTILINRHAREIVKGWLQNPASQHVILVRGARQVGKTTLVKDLLNELKQPKLSFNLEEDLKTRADIDQTESFKDFQNYLEKVHSFDPSGDQILFIDEAQESEKIGSYIRFMKEQWRSKVLLTGSSMKRIFRKEHRIPVGRYVEITVTPLTFEEFVSGIPNTNISLVLGECKATGSAQQITPIIHAQFLKLFDQYLEVGGLPEVVTTYLTGGRWGDIRNNILLTQKEDFLRKSEISKASLLEAALRAISNNLGYPSKYTQIAESYHQAKEIVAQLIAWNLVYEILQKGVSPTTNHLPKRYIYDHGISQQLRGQPFPPLSLLKTIDPVLRGQLGGVFENIVLQNLISALGSSDNITGWKKDPHQPTEVDFVWQDIESSNTVPIECKAALKTSTRSFNSLISYLNLAKLKTGILVSAAPYVRLNKEKFSLVNIPIYLFSPEFVRKQYLH